MDYDISYDYKNGRPYTEEQMKEILKREQKLRQQARARRFQRKMACLQSLLYYNDIHGAMNYLAQLFENLSLDEEILA